VSRFRLALDKALTSTDCKSLAPTWESLATDFVNEADVVIAKVDAESPDSKKTAEDQGVKSYPTIKWFKAGSKEPEDYTGGRSEADLVAFINKNAGTHRAVGGKLSATAGTIEAIDKVIQKIMDSGKDFSAGADEVVKAAKAQKGKVAEYYGKVAQKLKANSGYVDKEFKRLQGILKKGGLAPEKADDLTTRSNILSKFKISKEADEEKSEL
jgi:protein disulfide-isomerase A6